jgi:hypothetical protein
MKHNFSLYKVKNIFIVIILSLFVLFFNYTVQAASFIDLLMNNQLQCAVIIGTITEKNNKTLNIETLHNFPQSKINLPKNIELKHETQPPSA